MIIFSNLPQVYDTALEDGSDPGVTALRLDAQQEMFRTEALKLEEPDIALLEGCDSLAAGNKLRALDRLDFGEHVL